jgi:Spy/CpxP family protein refolding chaperone
VKRKSLLSFSIAAMVILTGLCWSQSSAQTPAGKTAQSTPDQDIDLLRHDVRSQKRQIIASNLQLTDQEAEKFWPLYDQYTADLVKINDAKYSALKEFAASYATMTDDQATALVRKMLGVDQSVAELRLRYTTLFNNVIPGRKTAVFFQLDRRLVMLIDLQIASQIPMILLSGEVPKQ